MIGGADITIRNPGRSVAEVLDMIVRAARRRWHDAVLQDAETGERFPTYAQARFGDLRELFIYRDDASFGSWQTLGADPSNVNTMIHVLVDAERITLVVDDPSSSAVASIRDEIKESLEHGLP